MSFKSTRTMTVSSLGPTAGELRELLAGISDKTRVHIHAAPSYNNPVDPGGEITITVDETPKATINSNHYQGAHNTNQWDR